MGAVVIDIRDTPTGKVSPFKHSQLTLYFHAVTEEIIDTIRLLSDFDENLFKRHPNADLAVEMERLHTLARRQHDA